MSDKGFSVDPDAVSTASSAFSAQASALQTVSDTTTGFTFDCGAGYYDSYGRDYATHVAAFVGARLPRMADEATSIGTRLTQTGSDYTGQDDKAASGVDQAGSGA